MLHAFETQQSPALESVPMVSNLCAVSGDTAGSSNSTGCQVVPGLLRLSQTGAASVPGMVTSSPTQSFTGKWLMWFSSRVSF